MNSFFLCFCPWTPEFVIFYFKFGFYAKLPLWNWLQRSRIWNLCPKVRTFMFHVFFNPIIALMMSEELIVMLQRFSFETPALGQNLAVATGGKNTKKTQKKHKKNTTTYKNNTKKNTKQQKSTQQKHKKNQTQPKTKTQKTHKKTKIKHKTNTKQTQNNTKQTQKHTIKTKQIKQINK